MPFYSGFNCLHPTNPAYLSRTWVTVTYAELYSAVGSASDYRSRRDKFESQFGDITFVEVDHEFLRPFPSSHPNLHPQLTPLPLIQEWQLSVTGKMCTQSTD